MPLPSYSPITRRRRVPTANDADDDDVDQQQHQRRSKPMLTMRTLRGPLLLLGCLALILLIPLSSATPDPVAPLRTVQLFRKPDMSTGQLIPVQEGLDVLRAQQQPFSIIAAVGPTRTGKSSILGRAFLRGEHENLFETGNGITSHTGGVWIATEPVMLTPRNGGPPIRVLLVDTEGFSGVGSVTSRTYEANLFGMVYLLSSALIFNSMVVCPTFKCPARRCCCRSKPGARGPLSCAEIHDEISLRSA